MSINQNFPNVWASLVLDFENSKTLDPRITFTRSSTATYVGSDGLIKTAAADEARFDHDPVTGESLGLLIEESRQNKVSNSISMTPSGTGASVTYNTTETLSPDGTNNATKIVRAAKFTGYSEGTSTTGVVSFFAKKAGNRYVQFVASGVGFNNSNKGPVQDKCVFDFDTETFIVDQYGFFQYKKYPNGWFRFYIKYTTNSVYSGSSFYLYTQTDASNGVGSATDDTGTIYSWGCQYEVGEFITSYIPTSGSQVTRQPDNASITGTNFSSWYSPFNGTYIIDIKNNSTNTSGLPSPFRTNSIFTFLDASGYYTKNNTSNVQISQGPTTTNLTKWAIYHDGSNGYGMTINGRTPVSGTQAIGTSDTNIQFNDIQGATSFYLNRLAYYPERLTDTQLQNLTK